VALVLIFYVDCCILMIIRGEKTFTTCFLTAAYKAITSLLAACNKLKVLVTSNECFVTRRT
jgi:hypothetical protein